MVLAHGVPFSADVLTGRLNKGKQVVDNPVFQVFFEHNNDYGRN
jgi:hypothetical protein